MKVTLMTAKCRDCIKLLTHLGFTSLAIMSGEVLAENTTLTEYESIGAIQKTAEEFAFANLDAKQLQDLDITASALDTRLRLKKCSEPLEAFSNTNNLLNSRSTVGVRCAGTSPWTLYVPINVHALSPVVYTAKPLLRGEVVGAHNIEVRYEPLDRLPMNALTEMDQVMGMEVSRALPADTALSLGSLRSARLINQGQEVIILAEGSGLAVRMSGNAMKHGAMGDVIPVKNASSGRVLEGRIVSNSTVLVGF